MQTFLPYPDFLRSLEVLDDKRLGKQRVETLQILNALTGKSKGWLNHPAVKMWRGYEKALTVYGTTSILVWCSRGFRNTISFGDMSQFDDSAIVYPLWFGNDDFHRAHRSNLLRKFPEHYRKFWPDEPDNLPYIWPV